ncbi:helix-turn-helix domain-containing protein [Lacisediminimonas profundi]|uniref:helix-turn-helix domain-containing protein n=1 Tax=Lacisediminimonas profundi TaxID=2603856 RepID=UPI00124B08A7|nr:helix-turn-helix domain-containing protein [Lacisediminimonas profundi]
MKSIEYLDQAKRRLGIESDYALAKALGITHSAMSNYRAGRSRIDDSVAVKVAQVLDINPMEIIAAANIERAKTDEMRVMWSGVMEKFSMGFEALLCQVTPCFQMRKTRS